MEGGIRYRISPLVLRPSRWACEQWLTIPEGFVAVVTKYGRYVGQWRAGFHWAPCWYEITHLIPLIHFVYDTPVKECPCADDVMVTVDCTLVFHVIDNEKSIKDFAYTMSPQGLDRMLKDFQEDAIRSLTRKRRYSDIYDLLDDTMEDRNGDGILDKSESAQQIETIKRDLNNQFRDYGIEITHIAVTNVHLPVDFANNLSEATVYQRKDDYNKLEQEYEIVKIEHNEKEAIQTQLRKEELEAFEADKKKELALAQSNLDEIRAETRKILAEIREQEKAEILEVKSKGELQVAEVNAKQKVAIDTIRAEGIATAEDLKVQQRTYIALRRAEAQAEVAANEAQALDISATAEANAAAPLASLREYQIKMRNLQVIRALGNNRQVTVTGNSGDNMLAQLMGADRAAAIMGLNK